MSSTENVVNLSRRRFLQAGGGLALGLMLPPLMRSGEATAASAAAEAFEPNPFIIITPDNKVTVLSKHLEMGQGTYTGLATLIAEELEASWEQVKVIGAPANANRFNNLFFGPMQGTGGSTAMANSWEQMRTAGASARVMLVNAAAKKWNVPAAEITVSNGVVSHGKQSASFGELVSLAAEQTVPKEVKLKDPKHFKLIGHTFKRKDTRDKIDGSATFTQDIQLPGMLVAVVAHPPRYGSKVKAFDATAAKKVKNVVDVVQIPQGIAVLAKDTWSAKKGRDALSVEWDDSAAYKKSSAEILDQYREMANAPGAVANNHGDIEGTLSSAATTLTAEFEFPFLAHAPMEPLNCVIQRTKDGAEVWNGEQMHTLDQANIGQVLGLTPDQVTIHTLYAGGSFGRRASTKSDYQVECAEIVKAIDGKAPIKLVWLREDDMRAGYYRPMYFHALQAALNADKELVGWKHRIVGQSIATGSPFAMMVQDGVDKLSVEGAKELPYEIPNFYVDLHTPDDVNVPILWWRSVGSTHTAFSTEVFLDQVAEASGKDPVALRFALMKDQPRHEGVLKLVAEKAGWSKPLTAGKDGVRRGRGVALHKSFSTYVAQVAEVSVAKDGSVTVDRVVAAVDCGTPINPDNIKAQVEGSVAFALSAVLHGEITLDDGKVVQGNFDTYPPVRMNEMPEVEVHIVQSPEAPTGIGEPAVPPLAPAVVNAIAAATGKRLLSMPLQTAELAV